MVATAELQAAIREALRRDRPQTDQSIWQDYFFGADEGVGYTSDDRGREHQVPLPPRSLAAR